MKSFHSRARLRALAIGFVASSAMTAGSMTIRHDVSDQDYINAGNAVPQVGYLFNGSELGSGTLIFSNWVLTAQHVALGQNSFSIGGNTYGVSQWVHHPLYDGMGNYDFSLGMLNSSVGNVTPMSIYTGNSENLQSSTIVGFGATGTGLSGYGAITNITKRGGTNEVNRDGSQHLLFTDFDGANGTDNSLAAFGSSAVQTSLEQCVAPGDSGGALIINGQLAGVTAFLAAFDGNPNADYGDIGGFGRVSHVQEWIVQSTVPEPGTFVALGVGIALLALRRRAR